MRAAAAVACLVAAAVVSRLMIHVVSVVATSCVGPRRRAGALIRWALSIRAFVHHPVVIVTHLENGCKRKCQRKVASGIIFDEQTFIHALLAAKNNRKSDRNLAHL